MNNISTRVDGSIPDSRRRISGFTIRNICEVFHTSVHDEFGVHDKVKVVLRTAKLSGSKILTAPFKEPAKLIIDDVGNLEVNPSEKVTNYVNKLSSKLNITQKKDRIVYSDAELKALDDTLRQMEQDIIDDEHNRANIQYVKDLIDKEPHDVHTKEIIDLFKQQYGWKDEDLCVPLESPFMPTGVGPQSGTEQTIADDISILDTHVPSLLGAFTYGDVFHRYIRRCDTVLFVKSVKLLKTETDCARISSMLLKFKYEHGRVRAIGQERINHIDTCSDAIEDRRRQVIAANGLITISAQSGEEEDCEMPSFERLAHADDIADAAFRSPQSSNSFSFSEASDSSQSISIESVKEIFETIRSTCQDCMKKGSRVEDRILRKIESVFSFMFFDWRKANGICEMTFTVVRLIRQLIDTDQFTKAGMWLADMFETTIKPQMGYEASFDLKWLFDCASSFCTSELYIRIKKFACALVALAVTSGMGKELSPGIFEKLWNMAKVTMKNSDIVATVLNFVKWMLQSGYNIITGKLSVHEFFTKPSEMQLFDTRVAKLDYIKAELEAGRDDEFTWCGFGVEIEALRKCAALMERAAPKQIRLSLANQLRKINAHWSYYKTKMDSQPLRKAPYSFMFIGGSSIAKSCLLPYTISMLQKALNIKQGAQYVYDYNSSDAYMSGFDNDKNAIQLDDAGNSLPEYSDKQVSSILIDLVNNNKRTAVMADLESKGIYLIKPDIVGVTTNRGDLHGSTTSVDGVSVLRRLNRHIYVRVKPEFATEGGMLRPDVDPREHKMDVWSMDVFRWSYESSESLKPVKIDCQNNLSYQQVQELLNKEAVEHHKRQKKLVIETAALDTQPICEHGVFSFMCKKCVAPQSGCEYVYNKIAATEKFVRLVLAAQVVNARVIKRKVEIKCSVMTLNIWVFYTIWANAFSVVGCIILSSAMTALIAAWIYLYVLYHTYRLPVSENMQTAVKNMASKVTKRTAVKFVAVISAMSLIHILYKTWKANNVKPQGGFASKIVGVSNAKNIYTEQYLKPMPINYDIRTASGAQMSEALGKRIMIGRFFESKDLTKRPKICVLVPIMSETVLCSWHLLRDNKIKYVQVRFASSDTTNATRLVSIEGQWKRIGNSDICIIRSATFGDQKNILKWFPPGSIADSSREKMSIHTAGCILSWMRCMRLEHSDGTIELQVSHGAGKVNATNTMVNIESHDLNYWGGKYMSHIPTWDGMCGSPLVTDRTSGAYIVGLHSGGKENTNNARFCTIMQEDIKEAIAEFDDPIVPNSIMHESANYVKALDFEGSVFRYTDRQGPHATSPYVSGEYDILGHNSAPRRTFRSKVKITKWSEELALVGYPRLHEAPSIINTFIPWNMWLTNVASPCLVEAPLIKVARDDYLLHILKGLDENPEINYTSKIRILSEDVVLAGLDGIKGIDAINRKTSLGIPYCKPKSTIIVPDDREVAGISVPLTMPQYMRDEICTMEKELLLGNRVYIPHRCNLKDEAVKINKRKVRVFMGSPFAYLFLMRKYFLTVSALIQECNVLFETAVGVNCFGKDWTSLYRYLTRYGDRRMVAGDYAAYDQKMEIALTKAAFEIILTLCSKAGYSEDDMTVCRGLITETIAGCYDLKGEWIGLNSANPSGHSLTVVINSLVNSILMRAAYYGLMPTRVDTPFADVVALLTYGDDNIMGVHESIPWFNHTTLAEIFGSWGLTYTMADKEAVSVPYICMSECSFLKRTWVYNEQHNMFFAPLDENSIMKTLHTYVMSEAIDINEQHAELLISANREYIMFGENVFTEKRAMLMGLAQQHDLLHFMPNMRLPTKEALYEWLENN